jgi:hypothetical protein
MSKVATATAAGRASRGSIVNSHQDVSAGILENETSAGGQLRISQKEKVRRDPFMNTLAHTRYVTTKTGSTSFFSFLTFSLFSSA